MRIGSKTRLLLFSALAVVLLPLAAVGGYLGYLQLSGNFHTVIENQLYRSGQPSAAALDDYVHRYGIKTVLNLRGANPKAGWYEEEVAESARLGIAHADFRMSASRELTSAEADKLEAMMRSLPKPLLIHCQAGADRSGLASAIYLSRIGGADFDTAGRQISLYYGHIGVAELSSAYAMDVSWKRLMSAWTGAKVSQR
jgi:protein tyrosine/serine phosphatase